MTGCSLYVYPEMMRDLIDFHNVATYTIVATSAGMRILFYTVYFDQVHCFRVHFCHSRRMVNSPCASLHYTEASSV